jgi:hypothetical protein
VLAVVKALIRNVRVLDPDLFMVEEPELLRSLVKAGDDYLLDLLQEEAEEREEYPDDDELEPLVAERRLDFWSAQLTDEEVGESGRYLIEVGVPGLINEMVGYCEMILTRQPGLAGAIADAQARFFEALSASGPAPSPVIVASAGV